MNQQLTTYIAITLAVACIAIFGIKLDQELNITGLKSDDCCTDEQLSNFQLTFDRTPCYGTCPVYSISINNSGKAIVMGHGHVEFEEIILQLTDEQLRSIAKLTYAANFYEIEDIYKQGERGCERYSTDSPHSVWSVTSGQYSNSVDFYYGCNNTPQTIPLMEEALVSFMGLENYL
ncbi:DUF6438 domain-containing protein [Pseudoalteromonas sp. McH1-42]|uniref:DUF6438 domain-containing protein n=1 Tax=Pseudoalteromonas sp. McH1-42 TaxID=2917752 RepID=UPI001EF56ED4|nr:DUF6438 domain-containing protein [Pseudoalteromonas sp. McH1-42]MCG7564204.1 DUF6438 domain-containing protein [Pseudoalteromonas sp. McH1-42]